MPLKYKKYFSIVECVTMASKEAFPSFLTSFAASFLLFILILIKKTFFNKDYKELINTVQEGLALNSICLLFCFCLMIWGIYLFTLGINPTLYFSHPKFEDWMLKRFSNSFVSYSAITLGVIFSARIFLRTLQPFNMEATKEVISIARIDHEIIIISLSFLIFVPYYYILRPIVEVTIHSKNGRIHKHKNRLKLIFSGIIIVCISTYLMYYFFLV
jgi:hypothetical protein